MDSKLRAGVIGGTGMVGQRFITLLENHPWFRVTAIGASERSAGLPYEKAVEGRWKLDIPIPESVRNITVMNAADIKDSGRSRPGLLRGRYEKGRDQRTGENYARAEIPVISNNSAHRSTEDVPMIIPK